MKELEAMLLKKHVVKSNIRFSGLNATSEEKKGLQRCTKHISLHCLI